MQKNLCLIFLSLLMHITHGQTTFSKLYTNAADSFAIGYSIAIDDSFYYVVGMGTVDLGAPYLDLFFFKTDYFGNRILAKYYYGDINSVYLPGYYNNLSISDDYLIHGGWYVYHDCQFPLCEASKGIYLKFNKYGDTLLTRKVVGNGYTAYRNSTIIDSSNDKLFIAHTRDTLNYIYHTYLTKYDSVDNLALEKKYGDGTLDELGSSVDVLPNGDLMIGGDIYYDELNSNADGKVYITDSVGNIKLSKTFGTSGYDIGYYSTVSYNKSSIIYTHMLDTTINEGDFETTSCITKTDLDGNVLWRTYFNSPYVQFFYTPRSFEDGSIVAVGIKEIDTNYVYYGYICKLDSNGNFLWEHTYTNNALYNHYIFDFQKTPDGGYICSGAGTDGVEPYYEGPLWLLKLDSMGCLMPGCGDVPVIDFAPQVNENILTIYPNPVTQTSVAQITIPQNFTVIPNQRLTLTFFDMSGKSVDVYSNISINNPGEVIRFYLHTNNLAAGIYTGVLVYNNTFLQDIKMIKK